MAKASVLYEFGDFRLDSARRLLLRGEADPVALTPKVFETLLYLVEHRGTLLDKDRIMEAVWPDAVVEENNLTQNISTLRRLLGETPDSHRYIVTVPGSGYRFVAEVKVSGPAAPAASVAGPRTFAVLPFRPLVPENRDAALEMGMADTLIARLSHLRGIVVRPLATVRRYVELEHDPLVAGREVGAESVLEGCIQKVNSQIRVTARLLRVADGGCLWAGTFNEKFTDIFAVQDAISEKAVAALELELSSEERRRLMKRYTENVKAYNLYLLGRHSWNKLTPPEIRKSIDFFHQAIALDPNYALAYAGIAEAYYSMPITSDVPPKESFPKAKAAARKAIELDEALSHPHSCLAFIHFWFDWDWGAAEKEAQRAIQLDPRSSFAHLAYAHLLSDLGRHEEAVAEQARARDLEPLSLIINALEGQFYYYAGRDEEAFVCLQRTLDLEPRFWVAHLTLGKVQLRQKNFAEAIAAFRAARQFSGDNSEAVSMVGYALALSGDRAGARKILKELTNAQKYVPPHNIAMVYQGLDAREDALHWLEKAAGDRDVRLSFLRVDPKWDALRDEPRFRALLQRVNLLDA